MFGEDENMAGIDIDKLVVGETFILIDGSWALYLGPGKKKKDYLSVAWQGRVLQAPINKMTKTRPYEDEHEKDTPDLPVSD